MGCVHENHIIYPGDAEYQNMDEKQLDSASKRSKRLDSIIRKDASNARGVNKLLLTGPGESGKSSMFKQMITLYGKGFDEQTRRGYIPLIHSNILQTMTILCLSSVNEYPITIQESNMAYRQTLLTFATKNSSNIPDNENTQLRFLTQEWAQRIHCLWQDPEIRQLYAKYCDKLGLQASAAYFLDKVMQLAQESYLPTDPDIYRCRSRTIGIIEQSFRIEDNEFVLIDVGGQRNERRKWIHCFENITCVLFVAALSEYDQVLVEDNNTNRMVEALNLFEQICNMHWFKAHSAMILFLNKSDLFMDKCKRVPIYLYFPSYEGEAGSYEDGVSYFQAEFERRNQDSLHKMIYTHCTNALDTNNVQLVFEAVKDIVIRRSLYEAGLQ